MYKPLFHPPFVDTVITFIMDVIKAFGQDCLEQHHVERIAVSHDHSLTSNHLLPGWGWGGGVRGGLFLGHNGPLKMFFFFFFFCLILERLHQSLMFIDTDRA